MPMPPALLQRDYPHVHTYVDNNEAYGLGGGYRAERRNSALGGPFPALRCNIRYPPPLLYIYILTHWINRHYGTVDI